MTAITYDFASVADAADRVLTGFCRSRDVAPPAEVKRVDALRRALEGGTLQPSIRRRDTVLPAHGSRADLRLALPYPSGAVAGLRLRRLAVSGDLSQALDRCAIAAACALVAAGREPAITVRVAAVTLADEAFPADFRAAVAAAGIRFEALELELDERDLLLNQTAVEPVLRELKALGTGLAIAGFGSTLASLATVATLGVTTITLDPALDGGQPLGEALADMARHLGLRLVDAAGGG